MDAFIIKEGDTQPSLSATLSDENGPIAIPGGATVKFVMRGDPESGGCCGSASSTPPALVVNAPAVIVNAPNGVVRYDWAVGDTAAPGNYAGEFKVTLGSLVTTYPSEGYIPITINPDLL